MDSPLTTHHTWRNGSPQSRPYALEAVLTPAVGIDLSTPRQRPGDPDRDRIFVLGKVNQWRTQLSAAVDLPR